ncbi:hypothetical protein CKF54_01120 [Psittacicella hinzii]|uniref:Cytochrome b561 bacterial/Ni-hydrogenase domain-containing protein n=1 Tax=Psittacicella hinzii TaxID=2028575 RepID=A0A3A1Y7P6_9GAMM|nr:cytochrome b [Psittacicella hinzii]RIY34252.1 hypothetical protein CKF54_01120 [Psittacicella hinzii]
MANPTAKYNAVSRSLHWLIVLTVLGAYVTIFTGLYPWHFLFGALTLVFATIRLVTMHVYAKSVPAIVPALPTSQLVLAKIVKILLALIFVLIPLSGVLFRLYYGRNFALFSWEIIPAGAVTPNYDLAGFLHASHIYLGYAGLALIGLHSVAALYHHYVRKDNTLKRMM